MLELNSSMFVQTLTTARTAIKENRLAVHGCICDSGNFINGLAKSPRVLRSS